jgi:D-3-phosphoglycerate dehydrogenase
MPKYRFVMAAGTLESPDVEQQHLAGEDVEVRIASLASEEEIARETADADGIIVTTNPLPAPFIAALRKGVRVIGRAGIGLDAVDLEAARRRGIAVFHVPDYATQEVATHALALILAVNRRLLQGNEVARNRWSAWRELTPLIPLHEQTAGVVGYGRIGRAVIDRLRPLVTEIVAYDPYAPQPPEEVTVVETLDDLLCRSDVLTLHIPHTGETHALIGKREIALMPKGASIVNVSRGKLIDEEALARALEEGHLSGAGLDVLVEEPPKPDAAILRAPNVLLSPHFAWYSDPSERRMRTMAVDGMMDFLENRPQRGGRLAVDPRS